MTMFASLFRPYLRRVSFALVLNLIGAAAGLGLIAFLNAALGNLSALSARGLLFMMGLAVTLFASATLSQSLFTAVGQRIVHDLRLMMSKRLLATDIELIQHLGSPKILAVLTKDIAAIAQAFNSLPFVIFGTGVTLAAGLYMALLYPPYFLILAIMTGLAVLLATRLMARSRYYRSAARKADDRIYAAFHAVMAGQGELKLNHWRERDFLAAELGPAIEDARALETLADRYSVMTTSWINSAVLLVIISVFALHVFFGLGTAHHLSGYALAILFVRSPIAGLMGQLPHLIKGQVALRHVNALGLSPTEDLNASLPPLTPDWQAIKMQNVAYRYRDEDGAPGFAFGPVDFTLKRGETVFIIGGNGSGKSTFVKLLLGLYTPQDGTVLLDNTPIEGTNRPWFRQHFAAVLSDYHLFKRLIGKDGSRPDETVLTRHLERFKLLGKLGAKDGSWSRTDVSQGQRKRLALISACLPDKPILALDEWAADQDPTFRRYFYTEIIPALQREGKTIIAMTHDEQYFHLADRVLKMEEGKLIPCPPNVPASALGVP